jgi:hypothetical protein
MSTRKYLVTVSRVEYFSTEVVVDAENEEEAKEMALYEADFGHCTDAEQSVEYIAEVTETLKAHP